MKQFPQFIVLIFITGLFFAGNIPQRPDTSTWDKKWKEVNNLKNKGLPESALKIVNEIYLTAKKEDNKSQLLKAVIYKLGLIGSYQENHLEKNIHFLNQELADAQEPERSVLYSLTAELYRAYYRQNRYKITNRSFSVATDEEPLEVWDARRINDTIKSYYLKSVNNEWLLQQVSLKDYKAVIAPDTGNVFKVEPTLYDLLAQRAIDYFSTPDASQFDFVKTPVDTSLLVSVEAFIAKQLPENDDSRNRILYLYQKVLEFHLKNGDTTALVAADLNRLNYLLEHSKHKPYTAQAYIRALNSLYERVKPHETAQQVAYRLAGFYMLEIANYNKNVKDNYIKAQQICSDAIALQPDSRWAKSLRGIIDNIHKPALSCILKNNIPPEKPILLFTGYRNTDTVYVKVVPYTFDIRPKSHDQTRAWINRLKEKEGVYSKGFALPPYDDYKEHSTELMLPGLQTGHYVVFLSNDKNFSHTKPVVYKKLQITNLSYIFNNNNKNMDIYVLNRTSGKRVGDAQITLYKKEYRQRNNEVIKIGDFYTDKNGFVSLSTKNNLNSGSYLLDISRNGDHFYANQSVWFSWRTTEEKPREKVFLFTDRAIYRPGQTVYFKAIAVNRLKNNSEAVAGKEIEIQLKDANYKVVSQKTVRTNQFGSAAGSFVLPTGKLNGVFRLYCTSGSATFRVEEYKRPTFKVTLDSPDKAYRLNDVVAVTGKAMDFAGSPLSGAKVNYRVLRQAAYFWSGSLPHYFPWPGKSTETEITNGQLITDDKGTFTISFKALPDPEQPEVSNFSFKVLAEVVDITGEMQAAEREITIGTDPFILTITSDKRINRETFNGCHIMAKNLSGKTIETEASVTVYRVKPADRVLIPRPWKRPDTLIIPRNAFIEAFPHLPYHDMKSEEKKTPLFTKKIRLTEGGTYLKEEIKGLPPGRYLISVSSTSNNGKTTTTQRETTLFSAHSKSLPVQDILWLASDKKTAQPGETVTFLVGSGVKNSQILLEIFSNEKRIKSEWIKAGKKQQHIEIPITENNRGTIVAKATVIRFNRSFSETQIIQVPFYNKQLDITLETQRDHLVPGKKEQWKVHINGFNGQQVAAELLAGMYDASLDRFAEQQWKMQLYRSYHPVFTWNGAGFSIGNGHYLWQPAGSYITPPQTLFPRINWFGYPIGDNRYSLRWAEGMPSPLAYKKTEEINRVTTEQEGQKNPNQEDAPLFDGKQQETKSSASNNNMQEGAYRSNFNETAFFYPQLHTDSLGNVTFSFTTPDALTEWKLMILAHTRDIKTGTLIQQIKARKELMILLNKPRFVVAGDQLYLTGKVVNFTNRNLKAKITVQFFNPMNNRPLNLVADTHRKSIILEIPAGKNASFSQEISIPEGYDLLGYRIKAVSDKFTDGIRDMIPVVPNKILVTETMPMWVKGNSTKTFHFEKLLNENRLMRPSGIQKYRYTVEFTSHPVWYAVQALPYLSRPKYESTQNLFERFYANTIAAGIVEKFPKIKTVLEQWKNSSPDAFLSNLEKNEALKNVVLDATPWVMEAENETEQKRRIALLFDLNNLNNQLETSLNKLIQRQMPSGAWPWFKGMYEDRYVTQNIVSGWGRLRKMGLYNPEQHPEMQKMLKKAIAYLDRKITDDYNKLLKQHVNLKKNRLNNMAIGYLYARSAFLDLYPVNDKNKKAFDYYVSQSRRYWLKQNNYLQAMIAITLERLHYRNDAEGILRSLTERALESDALGMYWRNNNSGWYWYQAPIETEVMIMEAYDEVMHDATAVEKMKIWLLKNKQTNRWSTSSATANAIYGLLMKGNNFISEEENATVVVGSNKINDKTEAGTGYIQKSWYRKEITPEMGTITVENRNKSVAWGAAYYQYFEKRDKVSSHQTDITIEKRYFLRKITPQGAVIVPVNQNTKLKTGDVLTVRLVVTTDRDMEYIHLKDTHAAAFEPAAHTSGTRFVNGISLYQNIKDASVDFFINRLPKGTHVLEYLLKVTQKGSFSSGIATVQSLYAPEFAAHSQGRHFEIGH